MNGTTLYEPAGLTPLFADAAQIPSFPWKVAPTLGHAKGEARDATNAPLDTAAVTIENTNTHATHTTATDGNGFFGWSTCTDQARVAGQYFCFGVTPGTVADAQIDNAAPVTSAEVSPASPNGLNGWYTTNVAFSLTAADNCSGIARTEYSTDGGQTWQPYTGAVNITAEGTTTVIYRSVDAAGNTESPSPGRS